MLVHTQIHTIDHATATKAVRTTRCWRTDSTPDSRNQGAVVLVQKEQTGFKGAVALRYSSRVPVIKMLSH